MTIESQGSGLAEALRAAPSHEQEPLLVRHIARLVSEILARETVEIAPEEKIFDLGLGSLQLVELKGKLEISFGTSLPIVLFFQHTSFGDLTTHLLELIFEQDPRHAGDVLVGAGDSVPGQPADAVQELEDELLRRVAELEKKLET